MTSALTVRRADATEVAGIHAAVLSPAFPATELEPADQLAARVGSGDAELWHVDDESGRPVGAAVTEALTPGGAVLLTYFAVRADRRGGGIGGRMLTAVLAAVVEHHDPPLVIAEVEHPDHHADHPAYGRPGARLRFYAAHGAWVIDTGYFQPPIGPGLAPVYAMLLLALHVRPDVVDRDRLLDAAGLPAALTALMPPADVGADADRVAQVLDRAERPGGVALLDPTAYADVPVLLPPA